MLDIAISGGSTRSGVHIKIRSGNRHGTGHGDLMLVGNLHNRGSRPCGAAAAAGGRGGVLVAVVVVVVVVVVVAVVAVVVVVVIIIMIII